MRMRVMAAALLCLCAASPVWAQFDSGAVLGTVRDASGGVLPGVTVTLLNTETGISATRTTDERGAYEFVTVRSVITPSRRSSPASPLGIFR